MEHQFEEHRVEHRLAGSIPDNLDYPSPIANVPYNPHDFPPDEECIPSYHQLQPRTHFPLPPSKPACQFSQEALISSSPITPPFPLPLHCSTPLPWSEASVFQVGYPGDIQIPPVHFADDLSTGFSNPNSNFQRATAGIVSSRLTNMTNGQKINKNPLAKTQGNDLKTAKPAALNRGRKS